MLAQIEAAPGQEIWDRSEGGKGKIPYLIRPNFGLK